MRNQNDKHGNVTGFILLILMVASLLMLTIVSKGQVNDDEQPYPERGVNICHRVIEDPNTTHQLKIDRSDLNAHLEHGDYLGVCKEELENYFDVRIAPNPYFEKTDIKYVLTSPSNVEMIIYDQIGNKVVTLVDEYQVAGAYSIEFNGSNICYAPGIHILRFSRKSKEVSSVIFKRLMEIH